MLEPDGARRSKLLRAEGDPGRHKREADQSKVDKNRARQIPARQTECQRHGRRGETARRIWTDARKGRDDPGDDESRETDTARYQRKRVSALAAPVGVDCWPPTPYLNGSMIDAGGGVAFKTSSLLAPVGTAVTA